MKLTIIFALLALCLLGFQNCAGGREDPSVMSKVQQIFPEIQAIQPYGNVTVSSDVVRCTGSCEVTYANGAQLGGNIVCDGSLTVVNDKLTCDNNLTMSK